MNSDKVRIDKFLWAIRLFKTRGLAKKACESNRVKIGGKAVKASHEVAVGDSYEIKTPERNWHIKVAQLAKNRMPYSEAIKYYIDLTPEEEKEKTEKQKSSFFTGKRLSKTGKPTKKQRRDMDKYLKD